MYGISEQDEWNFYQSVIVAFKRAADGKAKAMEELEILAKRAEELIARNDEAIEKYFQERL